MSRRGFELGPFPGINGVKAPFFSFALQNATKHLRMACKKLVCGKENKSYEIFFQSFLNVIYDYLSSHSKNV